MAYKNLKFMVTAALNGIKILDFSWVVAGPAISAFLADCGADVVHVESKTKPDIARTAPPFRDKVPGLNRSTYFANFNRNKYSLSLNLNHPKGVWVAKKLIAWADIVVENFTPGTMQKWGLTYDDLVKIKPNIIMMSASIMGQTGPLSRIPGYGVQLSALAGFNHIIGWPDGDPLQPYGAYTDTIGPVFGAIALVGALDYRRRTGKGMYLDLSQLEASTHFLAPLIIDFAINGKVAQRAGNRCPYSAPHGAYPCRGEDRWCAISVFKDEQWQNLCSTINHPEWIKDPRFATLLNRKKNEDELDGELGKWTVKHSAEEVMEMMQRAGVPAGVVQTGQDLHNDPQLAHRNHFWVFDHCEIGEHTCDAPSFKLSESPAKTYMAAPCLGEHTEHICTNLLGISDKKFVELLREGVLE